MSASEAALWGRALDVLAAALDERGAHGWIAGGCLRDALLRLPIHDIDLALTCDPLTFTRSLPRTFAVTVVPLNRDSVRVYLRVDPDDKLLPVDLSPLHLPGDAPSSQVAAQTPSAPAIESDLAHRDFRVNAMALPLAARREFLALLAAPANSANSANSAMPGAPLPAPASLIDPLDGYADLQSRILNLASSRALGDDAGRILRAARLVAGAHFRLAPALIQHARSAAQRRAVIPGDRIRDEMSLLLALPRAAEGAAALAEMDALRILIPDLTEPEQLSHALGALRAVACLQDDEQSPATTELLDALVPLASHDGLRAWYAAPLRPGVPRLAALRWALLIHATVPHAGASTARSNQALTSLLRVPLAGSEQAIVAAAWDCATWRERLAHARPTDAELRHLFAARSGAAVDMLVAAAVCNAALAGSPLVDARYSPRVPERVREILAVYFTDRVRLEPPPLLTGADLLEMLALPPGPRVGEILRHIREAQLDGAIASHDEAMALARRLAAGC